MKDFMTMAETAEMMRVTKRTVASYKARGILPYYQLGRVVRFRKSDIEQHIADNTNGATLIRKEVSHG